MSSPDGAQRNPGGYRPRYLRWLRLTGHDIECCPECHQGRMRVVATLAPPPRAPPP